MKARDQKYFDEGMAFALRIANTGGVEELRKECEYRNTHALEPNYTPAVAHAVAREFFPVHVETMVSSFIYALVDVMKIPPSMIGNVLQVLNDKADEFMYNPEALKEYNLKTNMNKALMDIIDTYNKNVRESK